MEVDMSRRPRLVLPEVPMHIIQRGNNRNACFFGAADYQVYLTMLTESAAESSCPVHAYVLMPNHIHILATPMLAGGAASMMKRLGQKYVQYINRRYQRFGTLWQGRYRSCLVGDERYFLICHRYIELNPVRAGLAAHPIDYEWSSYRINAHGQGSKLVVPHHFYSNLAKDSAERQSSYRSLFTDEMSENLFNQLRAATKGDSVLGSTAFADSLSVQQGRNLRRPLPETKR